jgi:phenylalanine-4-hydroxylase
LFDHLFSVVDRLEKWMGEGKLNTVAPGEPLMKAEDLRSLLRAALTNVRRECP